MNGGPSPLADQRRHDGIGLAEALLGLDGFQVLKVSETPDEVVIDVETTVELMGCSRCGTRAESQDRMTVEIRDLPASDDRARLMWKKRRWRCPKADCEAKTWTEASTHVSSRTVLTRRAGAEACRQVRQRSCRGRPGSRARRALVDGDGGGNRARHRPGGRPASGWCGHQPGGGRDLLPQGHPHPSDAVCPPAWSTSTGP